MKRIKTLSKAEKKALKRTIKLAKKNHFLRIGLQCGLGNMRCDGCSFGQYSTTCLARRTADEWKAWAEEEVC